MIQFGLEEPTIGLINIIFAKYSELEKVILYGSRAKGNFKPGSDIDLTFVGNNLNQTILNKIEDDIDDLLLPYSFDLSVFKHISNTDFIAHINRVGIVFYERKPVIETNINNNGNL